MAKRRSVVMAGHIEQMILLIRGQRVVVDADLAALYDVPTKVLNQAVTRNEQRFPADFMFRLTKAEKDELVTNCDRLQKCCRVGLNNLYSSIKHAMETGREKSGSGKASLPCFQINNVI